MLIGEYIHTLDPKKRVSLPSKFRKELGKTVVITHGLDQCLAVYSVREWKKATEKITSLSKGQSDARRYERFFLGGAVETEVDGIGRILVPDFLKDFAGLGSKVAIVGVHDRVEVWNEERWTGYKAGIQKQADALAEKLGEAGAL